MRIIKGRDSQKGAAAIEFALMLPLLLLFFFGMIIFFNYLMVSRKIDTAANDIAAIIAKEGRVAENLVTTTSTCFPTPFQEFQGGRATLDNSIKILLPILIYPLNYQNGETVPLNFNYQMVMGGVPLWSKIGILPPNPNDVKIIWQLDQGPDFSPTVRGNTFAFDAIDSGTLFKVDHQGQAYIAFAIEYPYKQTEDYFASLLHGAELGGYSIQKDRGLFDVNFETFGPDFSVIREAAYPVRPTSVSSGGDIIPFNDLNICTDCTISSASLAPACKPGCLNFEFDKNVSGCAFD